MPSSAAVSCHWHTPSSRRAELHPFNHKQIALLQTFADQAVIAIENTAPEAELQARNRNLAATSVSARDHARQPIASPSSISSSGARFACVTRPSAVWPSGTETGSILPAAHGLEAADQETFLTLFPIPLGPNTVSGRAILEGRGVVHTGPLSVVRCPGGARTRSPRGTRHPRPGGRGMTGRRSMHRPATDGPAHQRQAPPTPRAPHDRPVVGNNTQHVTSPLVVLPYAASTTG